MWYVLRDPSVLHGTDGMDRMGYWDCLVQGCTAWYVSWDPSVQHGADGMGQTSGTARVKGVLCGTSYGIPVYHMVHMGWAGQVGLPGSRV